MSLSRASLKNWIWQQTTVYSIGRWVKRGSEIKSTAVGVAASSQAEGRQAGKLEDPLCMHSCHQNLLSCEMSVFTPLQIELLDFFVILLFNHWSWEILRYSKYQFFVSYVVCKYFPSVCIWFFVHREKKLFFRISLISMINKSSILSFSFCESCFWCQV